MANKIGGRGAGVFGPPESDPLYVAIEQGEVEKVKAF